jgi:isocitrate dehydrogenase kinase/phosphatase
VYAEDTGGRLLGYCVSRINVFRVDYPVGFIVDVHALPGYDEIVGILAADALKSFDEAGVNIVNCQLVKGHPYVTEMERLGFLDSRVEFHMFYILYSPEVLDRVAESTPDRIYVSWGDHDVLPVKMPAYKK